MAEKAKPPTEIEVRLEGLAPVMFDKFIDYSEVTRPPEQKLYLSKGNQLVLPAVNIRSFLFGKNPAGAVAAIEGRPATGFIRYGESHVFIDPVEIPFQDGNGESIIFKDFEGDDRFSIDMSSPRTKKGSLSIKMEAKPRPCLVLPWQLEFKIILLDNDKINSSKLNDWFRTGGLIIGIGTHRPQFGRFLVAKWDEK